MLCIIPMKYIDNDHINAIFRTETSLETVFICIKHMVGVCLVDKSESYELEWLLMPYV